MSRKILSYFCVCFVIATASAIELQPKISPGYQPVDPETEKGLWMELEEYESSISQSALLIKDEEINRYVKKAACRVAGDYCNDIRIYIIRNPGFNASMTANGVMQIWSGLIAKVSSEDELAAVLGHELAHYTQLHTVERLRRIKSSLATSSVVDLFIGLPIATMSSVASFMSYNREQEEEADLLGVKFMVESGYEPHAAARVWQMVVEEEKNAVAKSLEPGVFSKTHPSSEDRVAKISSFIDKYYPAASTRQTDSRSHVEILNRYYMTLMEEQIDTNRFGRTGSMLRRHRDIGVNPSLIEFFHGEMYRQRNYEGDLDLARQSYLNAINLDEPVTDAYRNLGYVYLKQGQRQKAEDNFKKYLELMPEADDREMIEFYLEE